MIALLAVNALALTWLALRPAATDPRTATPDRMPAQPAAAPAQSAALLAQETTAAPVREATRGEPEPVAKAPVQPLSSQVSDAPSPAGARVALTTQVSASASSDAPGNESVSVQVADAPPVASLPETYSSFRAAGGTDFGPLDLSLHVFAADASARFAFVDGRKVTENSILNNNLRVVEIVPEGVIVAHGNGLFLLPRD